MSRRCAFLTTADPVHDTADDLLAVEPLRRRGWRAETIPWRWAGDWAVFDVVVIRSTWDYQHDVEAFLGVLAGIERAGARLENAYRLAAWNARKTYLRDLDARGVPVVPSRWAMGGLTKAELAAAFSDWPAEALVVKPVVGASAGDTFRLRADEAASWRAPLEILANRPTLVQPFIRAVVEDGEYSVFYFGGRYSHTVRKQPAPGDYRVQEELGGSSRPVEADAFLQAAAEQALAALPEIPLYARVDLVRTADGIRLMELELIEPCLYLGYDSAAPDRFAAALDRRAG